VREIKILYFFLARASMVGEKNDFEQPYGSKQFLFPYFMHTTLSKLHFSDSLVSKILS